MVQTGIQSAQHSSRLDPAQSRIIHNRALNRLISRFALGLGVFLIGFVMSEPAPYDLYMTGLITLWILLGLRLSRFSLALLAILLVFNIGGVISATQAPSLDKAPIYIAVSLFLGLTAVFYAAIIENQHQHLKTIFNAYLCVGVLGAILGILGYFNAFPGADQFTLYGRAKGAFKDPNVFAPFLMLPIAWSTYLILTGNLRSVIKVLPLFLILILGVFLSFSRAAWGMVPLTAIIIACTLFLRSNSDRFRLQLIFITLLAALLIVLTILVILQIPGVSDIFQERARLDQSYDGGRMGRFARHWYGMLLSLEHPLGIGPLEFGPLFGEDTHNNWLKAALDYGWLGFVSFILLTILTLGMALRILLRDRPWQPYLLCAFAVYLGHVIIGNIIDTDHWRHFYLLIGIIWGCAGLEYRHYHMQTSR